MDSEQLAPAYIARILGILNSTALTLNPVTNEVGVFVSRLIAAWENEKTIRTRTQLMLSTIRLENQRLIDLLENRNARTKIVQDQNAAIAEKREKTIHELNDKVRNLRNACCKLALSERDLKRQFEESKQGERDSIQQALEVHKSLKSSLNEQSKLKSTIRDLQKQMKEQQDNYQGLILQMQCDEERLQRKIDRLEQNAEQYRFAAIALKHVAKNLSSARINSIEWAKGNTSDHMTMRTKTLNQYRELIMDQPKYRKLSDGQYIIENNPLNSQCQYKRQRLKQIKEFVERNRIGNTNPFIRIKEKK